MDAQGGDNVCHDGELNTIYGPKNSMLRCVRDMKRAHTNQPALSFYGGTATDFLLDTWLSRDSMLTRARTGKRGCGVVRTACSVRAALT